MVMASRKNGIIWKADLQTGKVISSIQIFNKESKPIKYSMNIYLFSLGDIFNVSEDLIVSFSSESVYLIDIEAKRIMEHIEIRNEYIYQLGYLEGSFRIVLMEREDQKSVVRVGKYIGIEKYIAKSFQ